MFRKLENLIYLAILTHEILFRKVAHYLKKNYQNTTTICLKGKGHCEDALINPEEHIKTLNKVLKK